MNSDDDPLTGASPAPDPAENPDGSPVGVGTETSATGEAFEGLLGIFEARADTSDLPTLAAAARPVGGALGSAGSGGSGSPDSVPSIRELEGEFPELEIIELIARGGMGAVFKARQASLDRLVALKVLPTEWTAVGSFRERFEREAKTLAALNHPNIVTIHDFGERDGRFFFTMEFVDGTDLAQMMHSKVLTPALALSLIPQICEAIQFAHDRGVVHRDIKPGNILVGRDGRVKVVDFGIAKLGKSPEPGGGEPGGVADLRPPDLTHPRGVLGTPRYMAPEQAAASSGIDHRADLYALGVVFYEMLVGAPPERGKLIVRPSRRGKVDRRWDRIILQALEEDPARRYQNATEIRTAVEYVLAEQRRLVPRWIKAVALAALAAGLFFAWPRPKPEVARRLVNSLGMEFVPVSGVVGLVSVWETRVRDYQIFVAETGRPWTAPPFGQTGDHPAVHVSWYDARAFCDWLTAREREAGSLPEGERYRLPTDLEWSAMAHLTGEAGGTPQERHLGQLTVYPWGEEAPIPQGGGNYPDETMRGLFGSAAVTGYVDEFAATAPVGKFRATAEGLHDLGGNVWEWTDSSYSQGNGRPALRGGGWWASEPDDGWQSLLASHRRADVEASEAEAWDVGFRVVRGTEPAEPGGEDLFRLIVDGDIDGVSAAIAGGDIDLDAADSAGQRLIVLAADSAQIGIVKLLHGKGASLDVSDRRGRTPLHAAAEEGDLELVSWLLEQGVEPRPRTITGQEPMLLAVSRAPVAVLERLLAAGGADTLTQTDILDTDPLLQACLNGPDANVRWIIDQLSPEQVREASAQCLRLWGQWLSRRDSSLLSAFLTKAAGRLTAEMLKQATVMAVNNDREANFSLLLEAAGDAALDDEMMDFLGRSAAGSGRPWAIKALMARGWNPKRHGGESSPSLLHRALILRGEARQSVADLVAKAGKGSDEGKQFLRRFDHELAKMPAPATRETIGILAEAGLDIEARDATGRTPLVAAAMKGNLAAVERLLELGARTEAKDDLGFTALLSAIEIGQLEIVRELQRGGADFAAVNNAGDGVLHCVNVHADVLQFLLSLDLPVDTRNKLGLTPLVHLAPFGYEAVIAPMLEAGADVRASGGIGYGAGTTALHAACHVLDEGQNVKSEQAREIGDALGTTQFESAPLASRDERARTVRLLLAAGADPMAKNAGWMTPLHYAARSGLAEVVGLLVDAGSDPNAPTKFLNSPLHLAGLGGHLECAQVLLAHGAAVDFPGWATSLVISAIDGGNPDLLALLLKNKAPLDRRDLNGAFPLHLATNSGQPKMVEILLEAGADPDVRDFQYRSPLHVAAVGDHREIVDLLWRGGARMHAADVGAATPAQLAVRSGHSALAAHIEELAKNPVVPAAPANLEPNPPK